MTDAYDLRSNLKNKPGAQGTLFQVKDRGLLNPQQRWPKGYTPERQAEVSQALEPTTVHPTVKVNPPRKAAEVRARVIDAVARSTVPTEHLAGLREIHDQPERGTDATYWSGRASVAVDMFHKPKGPVEQFEVDPGGKNLIHELGHHRDLGFTRESAALTRENKNILYAANGKGYHDAGEAVADNYYVQHYREPGRKGASPSQGRYEDTGLADHMPAYREVRPLQAQQFEGAHAGQGLLPPFDERKVAAQADATRMATEPLVGAARRAAKRVGGRG